LRRMARKCARRTIGKAQSGNVQTRNTPEIPGLTLVDSWVLLGTAYEREFFLQRHLTEEPIDARGTGDWRDSLGRYRACADHQDGDERAVRRENAQAYFSVHLNRATLPRGYPAPTPSRPSPGVSRAGTDPHQSAGAWHTHPKPLR
jgi:hypothetical protein